MMSADGSQGPSSSGFEEVHVEDHAPASTESGRSDSVGIDMSAMTAAVGSQVASQMLSSGTESATRLVSSYARVDVLRPYFDLTPTELRQRLVASLKPNWHREPQAITVDMYGPTMLALTLAAVLMISQKQSGVLSTREGTLIGSSLAISFGYWLSLSGLIYGLGFIFNTTATLMELLTVVGYGLSSYCAALIIQALIPSTTLFLIVWLILGTLSAARLGFVLRSRTPDSKQGLILFGAVVAIHWTYLLYLRAAYATIYDAVADGSPPMGRQQ
eukprot:m.185247 g.185247  ORF g.185247 m.185247 type:complete len:273 (-) comp14727_c1_seq3:193-1011(-)